MGLAKKENGAVAEAPKTIDTKVATKPENGTFAAVGRLTTAKTEPQTKASSAYKPRDFDAEARGKTRCVQFQSALESPAIAGMKFDTMEQYLALVRQAAEAGVQYTFGE